MFTTGKLSLKWIIFTVEPGKLVTITARLTKAIDGKPLINK
jgi:hypothetical protein